jgi:type VI secretion system protein ImpK
MGDPGFAAMSAGGEDDDADRTIFSPGKLPGSPPQPAAPPPQYSPAAPQYQPAPPPVAPPFGQGPQPVPPPAFGTPVTPAPGYAAPPPAGYPPNAGAPERLEFAGAEPPLFGPEPLVAAAGRLIHLASHIKTMAMGPEMDSLRRLIVQELDAFTRRARSLGLEQKSIQLAHYILCAFIDDAVMSTPWGANSPWSRQSLLAAYHNDTQGGDRMFHFAEQMERDPNREPRLVELLYQCLSLGFEGRAALNPQGQSMLHARRAGLAALIAQQRGPQPADISPQWRGKTVASGPFAPRVPLWAVLSGIALFALAVFALLLFRLSSKADVAIASLDHAVGHEIMKAPAAPPQSATPTFAKIRQILAPDIQAGRLELLREGNEIVIRLHNQGLFASGQADASSSWSDTFARLAQAANLTKGPIRCEGHTDDQPIHSLEFPSNQELSEARAKSVADAIGRAGLADKSRLSTAGFGATRPIGDNKTEDGRRENRRVELRAANDIDWR